MRNGFIITYLQAELLPQKNSLIVDNHIAISNFTVKFAITKYFKGNFFYS